MRAEAPVASPADVSALELNAQTKIGDVAFVRWAFQEATAMTRLDGKTAIGIEIIRQAKANTIDISDGVRAAVDELRQSLPKGVEIAITSDDAIFIRESIHEVAWSLLLATVIVILIIFAFLGSIRATIAPAFAIPVSLIGTLAAVWAAGFSINILTLLALVIATGLVVDDAIIVVENIARHRAMGAGARAAAVIGTREIVFAVLAHHGDAGRRVRADLVHARHRRQPVLGVRLRARLRGHDLISRRADGLPDAGCQARHRRSPEKGQEGSGPFARVADALAKLYAGILSLCLKLRYIVVAACFGFAALGWGGLQASAAGDHAGRGPWRHPDPHHGPAGQQPRLHVEEDPGGRKHPRSLQAIGRDHGHPDDSRRRRRQPRLHRRRPRPWSERKRTQQAIQAELQQKLVDVAGLTVALQSANSLGIRGGGQGLRFAIAGPDYRQAGRHRHEAHEQAGADARLPQCPHGLRHDATSALRPRQPRGGDQARRAHRDHYQPHQHDGRLPEGRRPLHRRRDRRGPGQGRRAAHQRSVRPAEPVREGRGRQLRHALLACNHQGGGHRAEPRPRGPSALRADQRQPGRRLRARRCRRTAMRAVAAETLEPNMSIILLGEAKTLAETTQNTGFVFAMAFLVVFLVLSAQFESIVSALVILFTVPFGLAAATLAIALTGGTMNVYSQIGLVLVVGIMAKNGILIVEFANQRRDEGADIDSAIREASVTRLRPVMMTMTASVLGALPLIFATGAGARIASRARLGHHRRARLRHAVHAVPDADRLPHLGAAVEAARARDAAPGRRAQGRGQAQALGRRLSGRQTGWDWKVESRVKQ